MKSTSWICLLVAFLAPITSLCANADEPTASKPLTASDTVSVRPARSPDAARVDAEILHEAMHSTLHVVHDRYYREDEGLIIPASALREVFSEMKQRKNIGLRWLVVEGQAMNIDHVAQNEFEKAAVKALKSGKPSFEQVEDNVYRRAAPITLRNHCLKCHVPDRRSTRDRKAGLIISIPLAKKTQ